MGVVLAEDTFLARDGLTRLLETPAKMSRASWRSCSPSASNRSAPESCSSVLTHPGPVAVTSTKPEVLQLNASTRSRLPQALALGPERDARSLRRVEELRWSPVVGCGVWDRAVARASVLASSARPNPSAHDAHWVERGQALLAPLLHAAAVVDGDHAGVLSWLHRRELVNPHFCLERQGFTSRCQHARRHRPHGFLRTVRHFFNGGQPARCLSHRRRPRCGQLS
jgi:hypothetical protein